MEIKLTNFFSLFWRCGYFLTLFYKYKTLFFRWIFFFVLFCLFPSNSFKKIKRTFYIFQKSKKLGFIEEIIFKIKFIFLLFHLEFFQFYFCEIRQNEKNSRENYLKNMGNEKERNVWKISKKRKTNNIFSKICVIHKSYPFERSQ